MPIFGAFAAPILGMMAQSSGFSSVSQNITNMNTGGYKGVNTRFSTVLASTYGNNQDVGGVSPFNKASIDLQGRILSTTNNLDVAINGKGMFVLNTEVDGSGEEIYTRDGGFGIKKNGTATKTEVYDDGTSAQFTVDKGYLVDKNGYYVQAWEPDASGNFSTTSDMVSVRLDNDAFDSEAEATATATLAANLPAESEAGEEYINKASVYDANGTLRTFELVWTRQTAAQTWNLSIRADLDGNNGPLGTTTTNVGDFVFDESGHLPTGTVQAISSMTFTDYDSTGVATGTTGTVAFDLGLDDVTSIGQSFIYEQFQKDGRGPGELVSYRFDDQGQILGRFSNGLERALYKLPLATFVNADGLEMRQGNLFAVSVSSGDPVYRQVRDPAVVVEGANQEKHEFATFVPFAQELSNVNLENEFSRMILTQQAYNMSATVFKSVDEMTQTAAQLKA
jgi:flagellar hook protein FlgE